MTNIINFPTKPRGRQRPRIETLICAGPGCGKTARIHIVDRVNKATGKSVKVVVRGATYWGYGPDNTVLCPKCVGSRWRAR